ncbi:hypothetical protein ZWY2020_029573 [Hordeum vulgare]|nr:hypothetical protein ZWY2020_029573 [Hordeum vulgare]
MDVGVLWWRRKPATSTGKNYDKNRPTTLATTLGGTGSSWTSGLADGGEGGSNNSFGSPPFSLPVSKERNPEAKLQGL